MPHSVSIEQPSPADETMATVSVTHHGDVSAVEAEKPAGENGNPQESETADQDMTMADVVPNDTNSAPVEAVEAEAASEVKLEDLFADMDSDEEFPSSTGQDATNFTSSPPEAEAPLSPVYVWLQLQIYAADFLATLAPHPELLIQKS